MYGIFFLEYKIIYMVSSILYSLAVGVRVPARLIGNELEKQP